MLSAANIHVIARAFGSFGSSPHGARRYGRRSPRLEQDEIAFLLGRDLAERMTRQVRGFLHRVERNKANLARLAYFFKRPASAHITRQSLPATGRPFKGGNGGGHWKPPG